ncbi:MAG TPA: ATP-binding protein, partial [Terriglobia bacterium]|nr:ATP-binding protein [Terriglobia bacterium]
RRALWMRTQWPLISQESGQPLAITDAEVDRVLSDPTRRDEGEQAFYESDPTARALTSGIKNIDLRAFQDGRWPRLGREFGISPGGLDLLSLAVAAEIDPWVRRAYGYLHDDATLSCATPWLAQTLFGRSLQAECGPDSPLVRWRLAHPADGAPSGWGLTVPWVADPHIVSWIACGPCLDPALGNSVQMISGAGFAERPCLYPDQLQSLLEFVQALCRHDNHAGNRLSVPVEIELVGPPGSGKRTLAAQFSAALGSSLLVADAATLFGAEVPFAKAMERVVRAARLARLTGAILFWQDAEGLNPRLWEAARNFAGLVFYGVRAPIEQRDGNSVARRSECLRPLDRAGRVSLWNTLTAHPVPQPVEDWALSPAEIVSAASVAAAGPSAVLESCQRNLYQGPSELFAPLPCPYTWQDIVLPPELREHLAELEQQARNRWAVYDEWGFGRLSPLGRGISALFAGPSGTGKTMAAQVMARSLGMPLYRIDLAGIMNKYIGETEKRLKRVFEACSRSEVVLFFDEADALFGQRTQVKDAHDRFANIEIDYLLQLMEQFDGVAILATNRKADLDKAFLRRIRFIIDFLNPGPEERLALWRRALGAESPRASELLDGIEWENLAARLNMTGADITAAALSSAFLAQAEGARITMKHVIHAARREMTKHGLVIRPGEWEFI